MPVPRADGDGDAHAVHVVIPSRDERCGSARGGCWLMAGRAGTFIFPWTICSFNCCEVGSGNDGTGRFLVGAFTFIGATIVLLLLAESCYRVATAASATLHRPGKSVV